CVGPGSQHSFMQDATHSRRFKPPTTILSHNCLFRNHRAPTKSASPLWPQAIHRNSSPKPDLLPLAVQLLPVFLSRKTVCKFLAARRARHSARYTKSSLPKRPSAFADEAIGLGN